ncbi:MAG: DUF3467 domain-containing protein [Planctomycetota bacterium]
MTRSCKLDNPATNAGVPQAGSEPQAPHQQARAQVEVDDSQAVASYSNFCRVTGTPEELIIDFGLNPQPVGVPTEPIRVSQRIITNFYTAKRMLQVLQTTVQRHEATFGALEIDVQRRVQPGAIGQPQPPATR